MTAAVQVAYLIADVGSSITEKNKKEKDEYKTALKYLAKFRFKVFGKKNIVFCCLSKLDTSWLSHKKEIISRCLSLRET